jgi:hypothetical protein
MTRTVFIDTSQMRAKKINSGTTNQWKISGLMPKVFDMELFILVGIDFEQFYIKTRQKIE